MPVINTTKNTIIADKAEVADSFLKRLVGLLGRSNFQKGEALILKNTSSVHTFWMRFPIDVLFVNHKNVVVAALENLKPFRLSAIFPFSDVIEVPAGTIQETRTQKGDSIQIS